MTATTPSPGRRRGGRARKAALVFACLGLLFALPVPVGAVPRAPTLTPIEDHYARSGPWPVASTIATGPGAEHTFRILHPALVGTRSAEHPILIWGNGTNSTPAQYQGVLRHLASWGFVVIGSDDRQQADGESMLDALRYLLAAAADPGSRFFDRLATERVGALGHSQGAGGTVNAATRAAGLIDTAVPINLPAAGFVAQDAFDVTDLDVPTLFLGGSYDLLAPPSGIRHYYDQVPHAAMAVLIGADHSSVQHSGGKYLGYLTAWLRWQLRGEGYAGTAFTGPSPEIARNPGWLDPHAKGLARGPVARGPVARGPVARGSGADR